MFIDLTLCKFQTLVCQKRLVSATRNLLHWITVLYILNASRNVKWLWCRSFSWKGCIYSTKGKGKAVPWQAWSSPECSRKLRIPDFMTTARDGGKVYSLTHWLPLPPGNAPDTHFCWRLCRPETHSVIGRVMSMKNSNDTSRDRTSDLSICSTAP